MDQLAQCLYLAEHASRCVYVSYGDDLVLLLFQSLLHGVQLRTVTDWCLQLRNLCAVGLKAVSEGVGKVASVEDESLLAWLDQIGSNLIPTESSRSRDYERLRCRVGGLKEFTEHGQCFAKDVDKGHADMRFAMVIKLAQWYKVGGIDVPVMAHSLQNSIVEFNGARNEQGGVRFLVRHFGRWLFSN